MKRVTGVTRRSGTAIWQWSIKPPADLRAQYPTQWAHRCSLRTADLRQANAKAARLMAWWHDRFEEQRASPTCAQGHLIKPIVPRDPPRAPSQAKTSGGTPTPLRTVYMLWKAAKKRSTDSASACERSLTLFEQFAGALEVGEVTRSQGDAFRAHLLDLPFSSKTKHDHMTWLKSLLKYACRDLELIPRNPWEGLDIAHQTESPRKPWTVDQLRALTSLALFQSYALPQAWRGAGAAAYWIPLLGMFTGARVGELCQLRVADIHRDSLGAWIEICEEAEGSSVKTAAGIRQVPVHSELIRLGFLDYVDELRRGESAPLWPAMRFRKGKPGAYFSGWFGDLRRTFNPPLPDFHSLRHTVRTAMTEAGISEPVQDRITGHEVRGSTGSRTYAHPRRVLRTAIEAIQFSGITLPRCYQQQGTPFTDTREIFADVCAQVQN